MGWGDTLRNAWLQKIPDTIGTAMKIRLLTGAVPANCAATETGTLICEISCPSTYFDTPASGQMAKVGAWAGTSSAIGVIGYARLLNSAGTVVHGQALVSKAMSILTSSLTAVNGIILNFSSTSGVTVGDQVRGTGIETGTIVLALTSTTVTISRASTAGVASGARITFGDTSGDTFLNVTDITSIGQAISVDEFTIIAPGAGS
jgi:hypothetical protein